MGNMKLENKDIEYTLNIGDNTIFLYLVPQDTSRLKVGYKLLCGEGNTLIFEGYDYQPSPLIDPYSEDSVYGLLGFLSLKIGDTDSDYFKHYTKLQFEWLDQYADEIQMILYDKEI